jgi:hypothetical protein
VLAIGLSSCFAPPQSEDDSVVVQNYMPPPWAPPYDNVSSVRYYYLPDYEMYYDVWDGDFWYVGGDGAWISSLSLPPAYGGMDLNGAFIVLIDRDMDRPWQQHEYYRDNYPSHGYDQYKDIVVHNRIVTNTEPNHELIPRAFNENTNRVTFMQRPIVHTAPEPPTGGMHSEPPGAAGGRPAMPPERPPVPPPQPPPATVYHHVVHEVPMRSIAPSMPAESKNYNYGSGYSKARAPQARAPQARAPQAPAPQAPAPQTRTPQGGGTKK